MSMGQEGKRSLRQVTKPSVNFMESVGMSAKEQRMLRQALSISLVETSNISNKIQDVVKPMPSFYPTE